MTDTAKVPSAAPMYGPVVGPSRAKRSAPPGSSDPIDTVRDWLSKRLLTWAAASSGLFAIIIPLLFKWFGGLDDGVAKNFPPALRLFLFVYLAGPAILTLVIGTRSRGWLVALVAAELLAIAQLTTPLRSTPGFVLCVSTAALLLAAAWSGDKLTAPSRRNFRELVVQALPITLFAAIVVALAIVSWIVPTNYVDSFQKPIELALRAESLAREIQSLPDSFSVAARTVEADAHLTGRARPAPVPDFTSRGDKALLALHNLRTSIDAAAANLSMSGDSTPWDRYSTTADALRLSDIAARQNLISFASGAALFEARASAVRLASSNQAKAVADSESRLADQQLRIATSTALANRAAANLFNAVRARVQRAWAPILKSFRLWALSFFGALGIGLLIWMSFATDRNGSRAAGVLVLIIVTLIVPLIRPIYENEIDPFHPFEIFNLPTWSIAATITRPTDDHRAASDSAPAGRGETDVLTSLERRMLNAERRISQLDSVVIQDTSLRVIRQRVGPIGK